MVLNNYMYYLKKLKCTYFLVNIISFQDSQHVVFLGYNTTPLTMHSKCIILIMLNKLVPSFSRLLEGANVLVYAQKDQVSKFMKHDLINNIGIAHHVIS